MFSTLPKFKLNVDQILEPDFFFKNVGTLTNGKPGYNALKRSQTPYDISQLNPKSTSSHVYQQSLHTFIASAIPVPTNDHLKNKLAQVPKLPEKKNSPMPRTASHSTTRPVRPHVISPSGLIRPAYFALTNCLLTSPS